MRAFLLLILAFSVAPSAFAQTRKEKWEGYRAVEDLRELNLPFQEFAENAVLDFETIGTTKTPGEKFEIIDVESVPQETDKKVLSSVKNYVPFQIETCRKQGLRYCPVLKYSNSSTLFFNNNRFYTCRHGFHNWLAIASTANGDRPVNTISPPIILRAQRDGKTRIVYNSAYIGEEQLQFSIINSDPRLNYQEDAKTTPYSSKDFFVLTNRTDFVEMTLSKSILSDYQLPVRQGNFASLKKGEEIYALGYPAKTDFFPNSQGDAKGFTLMASHGYLLDFLKDRNLFYSSAFISGGMSGGVTLSAAGEILGLNCGGFEQEFSSSQPEKVKTSTFPIDNNHMEQFWLNLVFPSPSNKQASIIGN